MAFWNRRRPFDQPKEGDQLRRTLGWPQLLAMGIGALIGTGIYTLTGVSAGLAGPAVVISFMVAIAVCACAALCYSEMATMIPTSGSAYTYVYTVLGEQVAWVVFWSLILEYTVACSAVAVGWAGYAVGALASVGAVLPPELTAGPFAGGLFNLPAVFISLAVMGLLILGTRESANVTLVLVVIKVIAIGAFVVLAGLAFDPSRFTPFMPNGFFSTATSDGTRVGVMAAASLIFFAFYGFDALSTAAEETKRPERDLTIAIIGSLAVVGVLYMGVATAAIGAWPVDAFSKSGEPLAFILRSLQHPKAAFLIGAAAVVALPSVIMVFMYGQSRIFFAAARDGLMPPWLTRVNKRFGTPHTVTLATGFLAAAMAAFLPFKEIAELANAGTLCAFFAVGLCVLVLRFRDPGRERIFRAPAGVPVALLCMMGTAYLFISLPDKTITRFLAWNAVGIVVYLFYGARRSHLAQPALPAS